MPKAYVIVTEDIHDRERMNEYAAAAMKAPRPSAALAVDGKVQVLEGEWPGTQTVVLEFESVEAARAWYESDEYQAAAKIRREAATSNAVIITGLG